MPPVTWTAPSRRPLLPFQEDFDEDAPPFGTGRPALVTSAVLPEVHASNARFTESILRTSNYDDSARTVLSDLARAGEAAAPRLHNLVNQLHERDPEVAASFVGSMRRIAEQSPSQTDRDPKSKPSAPASNFRRTIGHYLFPGQVRIEDENVWLEAGADFVPFLGNIRSASQAARDVEEAIQAFRQSDYSAFARHGAMAVVDTVGAIPGAGNLLAAGKPAIRNALRATPGLRRAHSSWTLAKAARQFDKPISASPETLYGEFWSDLSPRQQRTLKSLQPHITGKGGEHYNRELLTSGGFQHQGDGKVLWRNPSGKPRIYDAETAERFQTIFSGLLAVPDKRSGSRSLYELKVAGSKLTPLQKKADAIISKSENIEYLRLHLDEIPFEFLASQTKELLQKSGTRFAAEEIDDLVKSMRRARTPEGKPLTTLDWLMGIARIGADAVRSESTESD
jgi:hypothetical protein